MIHKVRNSLLFLSAIILSAGSAWADDSPTLGDEIVSFLNAPTTSPSQLYLLNNSDDASVQLMQFIEDAIFSSDATKLSTAIESFKAAPPAQPEERQKMIQFSEGIVDIFENSDSDASKETLIEFLESYTEDESWYIQSSAQSLSAFLHISYNELQVAAEHVDNALQIIPSELSERVTASRLLASDIAMVLHGLQGNPDFMLDAARLQKQSKAEIGETINSYELMTNFVYALNRKRDFLSAAQVATLLLQEERPDDAIPGLAEAYIALSYNELDRYGEARDLAENNISQFDHPVVIQRSNFALMVAYAGLGDEQKSRTIMNEQGWTQPKESLLTTVDQEAILHAEALLAMHRGDSQFSLDLMKRRADLLIGRIQNANSNNMTAMLSSLENTRSRQSERESALQRETEMRAVQLEQKTKLNRMLWVLIGGLTIAFNFLLAFLRYREKLNVKVQGLQEDALSSEKMKTEFLGVINHELRTPLNGIIGISDAMIHHANSPVLREQAEAVQESGQLLFDLLDSLITMSTIEGDRLTLDKEAASLATTISREIAEWVGPATKKGLTFTHFIAPELNDNVISDHKRIRQSLHYLLSNAVRFTHTGRVHLHATAEPEEDGHITAKIIIADTGQGISEDVQSRLFQPFLQADATMTRKYGGAGLSLAIARKLARMMDGDLTVKSREGRGTEFTFSVRLPVARDEDKNVAIPALTTTTHSLDKIEAIETPEEIIDLMLTKQLSGDVSPAAQTKQYKAAG